MTPKGLRRVQQLYFTVHSHLWPSGMEGCVILEDVEEGEMNDFHQVNENEYLKFSGELVNFENVLFQIPVVLPRSVSRGRRAGRGGIYYFFCT